MPALRYNRGAVTRDPQPALQHVHDLVDEYRTTCLWFLREDYYPQTVEEALRVLDAISRSGDLIAFQKTAVARRWLSHPSSSPSAV